MVPLVGCHCTESFTTLETKPNCNLIATNPNTWLPPTTIDSVLGVKGTGCADETFAALKVHEAKHEEVSVSVKQLQQADQKHAVADGFDNVDAEELGGGHRWGLNLWCQYVGDRIAKEEPSDVSRKEPPSK